MAEAYDRVVRMHFAADELVRREDRFDRLDHWVAVKPELGKHAFVAESAEHNALGTGHVERFEASLLDPAEDLVGVFLGRFALENDNHLKIPWIEGMKKPAGSRRV